MTTTTTTDAQFNGLTISIECSVDWGCDYTDADRTAFESALETAVEARYPGATCTVEHGLVQGPRVFVKQDGKILGSARAALEDEIVEFAKHAHQDVWNDGVFWPAA